MITRDALVSSQLTASSTGTITGFTTTKLNELIIIFSNVFSSSPQAISSISGGGLTWIKVKAASGNAVSTGTGSILEECWVALCPNIITSQTFTITYAGSNSRGNLTAVSYDYHNTLGSIENAIAQYDNATSGTGSSYASTLSARSKNGLIIYAINTLVAGTITPTGGTTLSNQVNGSGTSSVQSSIVQQTSLCQRGDTSLMQGSLGSSLPYCTAFLELLDPGAGMVFKGEIGNTKTDGTASSASLAVGNSNYMYEVPSGSTIVVEVGLGSAIDTATVTDSQGNVYLFVVGDNFTSFAGDSRVEIWHCASTTTKLQNGDTINVSFSGGATGYAIGAFALFGIASKNPIDSGIFQTGNGSNVSSGTTQKQQANEIVLGFAAQGFSISQTLTPTPPFADGFFTGLGSTATGLNKGIKTLGGNRAEVYTYFEYTTSAPPQPIAFSGTLAGSGNWLGIVELYRENTATISPPAGLSDVPTGFIPIGTLASGTTPIVISKPYNPTDPNPDPTVSDPGIAAPIPDANGDFPIPIDGLTPGVTYTIGFYYLDGSGNLILSNFIQITINAAIKKKRFAYKIYDPDLNYITTWSIDVISDPTFQTVVNGGSGQLMVRLGRQYTDFDEGISVTLNNRVELWCYDCDAPQGIKIYTGYISAYAPTIDNENQYVDVTVLGFATTLTNHILTDPDTGETTITYNGFDPSDILKDAIDKYHDDGGNFVFYTINSILQTNATIIYEFINNTIQEVINKVIQFTPYNWFWFIDANGIINMNMANIAKADHILTIGKDLSYISANNRLEGVINYVEVIGGGTAPQLFNAYPRVPSIDSYGKWLTKIQDYRITDDDTSDMLAARKLNQFETPEIRTTLHVTDNNGDDQMQGADIEQFFPGQTIQVVNLPPQPILIIQSITYYLDHLEIEASTRLPEVALDLSQTNINVSTIGQTQLPDAPAVRTV